MEANTRTNLLRTLIAVFVATLFLIISINYFVLNQVLLKSAVKSVNVVASEASERIAAHLQPLVYRADVSAFLINREVVIPGNTPIFIDYLHTVIDNAAVINAAYFADMHGNFYLLKKSGNQFISNIITRSNNKANLLENTFDADMNLIASKPITSIDYDPRNKLWYQQAVAKKSLAWYVFPIMNDLTNKKVALGEASIIPVYDKSNSLVGVFGIDVFLSSLQSFIQNLDLYPNSIVLINDESEQVITAFAAKVELTKANHMSTMTELQLPWIKSAFATYQQNHQSPAIITYANHKYLAVFKPIATLKTEHSWYVSIITPLSDIVSSAEVNTLLMLMVALGVIIIVFIAKQLLHKQKLN